MVSMGEPCPVPGNDSYGVPGSFLREVLHLVRIMRFFDKSGDEMP